MRRFHLIEIEDLAHVPRTIRDAATENLQFVFEFTNQYGPIVPYLRRALDCAKSHRIVDLCSGGGGPWMRMSRDLQNGSESAVEICLTDKYPNVRAFEHARAASGNRLTFHDASVDARYMPSELRGFRTFFSSFHHFRPHEARAILQDSIVKREGIGIFEVTARQPAALFLLCFAPLWVLSVTPFIRPFRWSRLFWTYLIPIVPLIAMLDGLVSCLRTYSAADLHELTKDLEDSGYKWEIGQEWANHSPIPITYLLGYPTDRVGND